MIALIVAVLVQLYNMANSPNAFPGLILALNLPPFITSTSPPISKILVLGELEWLLYKTYKNT